MSVRILEGNWRDDSDGVCFYCSTSMWAFGPIMSSVEEAELFLKYLVVDPRLLTDKQLADKYSEFRTATVECTICRQQVPYFEYYDSHIDSHPCE